MSLNETPTHGAELGTERDPAGALQPGDPERLGRYELLGRLGSGGMGTVYLAASDRSRRRVAVKVIRPELARDDAFIARFHREVDAARKVAGFCTARVLDADLDAARPYLVTEYVEGIRLDRAVSARGPLGDSNLDGFAVGVAAALTAIHAAGVVHRDLKPSNVLLSYFGPRVIDFGIARALDARAVVTRASLVMGTPGWMAPEQVTGEGSTQAGDIFVWGSLVAFAATGRQPFGEGAPPEIAYRIVHQAPDLDGFQGPLRVIVERAMRKDPSRRPGAKALLMELLGEEELDEPRAAVTEILQRTWMQPQPAARPTTEELPARFQRVEPPRKAARPALAPVPVPPRQQAVVRPAVAPQQQWNNGAPWAQPGPQPAHPLVPVQRSQPPAPGWQGPPQLPPPPARSPEQRTQRVFARLLAWVAVIGALLSTFALATERGFQLFGSRMVVLFGALTIGFWLVPPSRLHRVRAVFARLVGLVAIVGAVGSLLALADQRIVAEFDRSISGAFLLLLIAYWLYPKHH